MALEEAISILAILTPIAKAVPVLGSPVEGSLEALTRLLELAKARRLVLDLVSSIGCITFRQGVKTNKEKTKELAVQATRWLDTIVKILKELELKVDPSELEGLRPNMEEIFKCVAFLVMRVHSPIEFTVH
jgi:hypothetical protein